MMGGGSSSYSSTSRSCRGHVERRRIENADAVSSRRRLSSLYPTLSFQKSGGGGSGGSGGSANRSSSSLELQQQRRRDPQDRVVMSQLTIDSSIRSQVTFNGIPPLGQPSASNSSHESSSEYASHHGPKKQRHHQYSQDDRCLVPLSTGVPAAEEETQGHHFHSGRRRASCSSSSQASGSILKTSASHRQHREPHQRPSDTDYVRDSSSTAHVASARPRASSFGPPPHDERDGRSALGRGGPGRGHVLPPSRHPLSPDRNHTGGEIDSEGGGGGTAPAQRMSLLRQAAARLIVPFEGSGRLNVPYPRLTRQHRTGTGQDAGAETIIARENRRGDRLDADDNDNAAGSTSTGNGTTYFNPNSTKTLYYLAQDSISEDSPGPHDNATSPARAALSAQPLASAAVAVGTNNVPNSGEWDGPQAELLFAAKLDSLLAKRKSQIEQEILERVHQRVEAQLDEKVTSAGCALKAKLDRLEAEAGSRLETRLVSATETAASKLGEKAEALHATAEAKVDQKFDAVVHSIKERGTALDSQLQQRLREMTVSAESRLDRKVIEAEGYLDKKGAELVGKVQAVLAKFFNHVGQFRTSFPKTWGQGWDDIQRSSLLMLQNCRELATNFSVTGTETTNNDSGSLEQLAGETLAQKPVASLNSEMTRVAPPRRSKRGKMCPSENVASPPMTIQACVDGTEIEEPTTKRQRFTPSTTRDPSCSPLPTRNVIEVGAQRKEDSFRSPLKKSMSDIRTSIASGNSVASGNRKRDHENVTTMQSSSTINQMKGTKRNKKDRFSLATSIYTANDAKSVGNNVAKEIVSQTSFANGDTIDIARHGVCHKRERDTPVGPKTSKRRLVSPFPEGAPETQKSTKKQKQEASTFGLSTSTKRPASKSGTPTIPRMRSRRRQKAQVSANDTRAKEEQENVVARSRSLFAPTASPAATAVPRKVIAYLDQAECPSPLESSLASSWSSPYCPRAEAGNKAGVSSKTNLKGKIRATYGSRHKFDLMPLENVFSFD